MQDIVQHEDITLPSCSVQYPSCGACYGETEYDGDSFYCDDCQLDYGHGEDCTQATYRDEDEEQCAAPCGNTWHNSKDLGPYECRPCQLPASHRGDHWTNCQPIFEGAV